MTSLTMDQWRRAAVLAVVRNHYKITEIISAATGDDKRPYTSTKEAAASLLNGDRSGAVDLFGVVVSLSGIWESVDRLESLSASMRWIAAKLEPGGVLDQRAEELVATHGESGGDDSPYATHDGLAGVSGPAVRETWCPPRIATNRR